MKIYKYALALLMWHTGLSGLVAGDLSRGPEITASDLACQLGVFNTSLLYKQDKPFSKLTVGLVYKERNDKGEYTETKQMVGGATYPLPKSTTEQVVKIFADKTASTVIVGPCSYRWQGIELPVFISTRMPPEILKDGNYALVKVLSDPQKNDSDENVKGIWELILKAGE